MKSRLFILLASVVRLTFFSYSMATTKAADPRFNGIFRHTVYTKESMKIYEPSKQLTGDAEYHWLTSGTHPFPVSVILPKGHPVTFHKLRIIQRSGGAEEELLGTTVFQGKTFRVSYSLGLAGNNTDMGWRRIYVSFRIPTE
jgi:hypothetical protein